MTAGGDQEPKSRVESVCSLVHYERLNCMFTPVCALTQGWIINQVKQATALGHQNSSCRLTVCHLGCADLIDLFFFFFLE